MKNFLERYYPVILLIILFAVSTYFSSKYQSELQSLVEDRSLLGMLLYILIISVTTVIAPVSNLPLIAVASQIWGPIISATLSIVGWLIGALIIFGICRKYGVALIEKLVSIEKIEKIRHILPDDQMFWSHILLRMMIPVDILSYLLGLFSSIQWKTFTLTTFIGITPLAFVFAFGGTLSVPMQIIVFIIGAIILGLIYKKHLKI